MTGDLEALKAENAWLKGLIGSFESHFPFEWDLTKMEVRIMGRLMRGSATVEQLIEAVYWDRPEPNDAYHVIHNRIKFLRRKLECSSQISLVHTNECGYHLEPSPKQIVMRYI